MELPVRGIWKDFLYFENISILQRDFSSLIIWVRGVLWSLRFLGRKSPSFDARRDWKPSENPRIFPSAITFFKMITLLKVSLRRYNPFLTFSVYRIGSIWEELPKSSVGSVHAKLLVN